MPPDLKPNVHHREYIRILRRLTPEQRLTHDIDLVVSAPEDTILAKLRWAELTGSKDRGNGEAGEGEVLSEDAYVYL